MNNKLILADGLDVLSYVLLTYITTTEVLSWIYTILLIISLALGIGLKILSAVKDGKISREEVEEIKKAVNEAKNEVRDEINKEAKEDGIHNRDD